MVVSNTQIEQVSETAISWYRQFFLFRRYIENLSQVYVATLGPAGTSSELATSHLLSSILRKQDAKFSLFSSYEESFDSLLKRDNNLLVVANAYERVDKFYMSIETKFLFSFVFDTPLYGVAKVPDYELPKTRPLRIATHHAPSSLIPWFLSNSRLTYKIVLVNSTSQAALSAQRGEVDLCVTNLDSAQRYGVDFISPTRSIRMLWSVFGY